MANLFEEDDQSGAEDGVATTLNANDVDDYLSYSSEIENDISDEDSETYLDLVDSVDIKKRRKMLSFDFDQSETKVTTEHHSTTTVLEPLSQSSETGLKPPWTNKYSRTLSSINQSCISSNITSVLKHDVDANKQSENSSDQDEESIGRMLDTIDELYGNGGIINNNEGSSDRGGRRRSSVVSFLSTVSSLTTGNQNVGDSDGSWRNSIIHPLKKIINKRNSSTSEDSVSTYTNPSYSRGSNQGLKRSRRRTSNQQRFNQGEKVLVKINFNKSLVNESHAAAVTAKMTASPVNKFGYPKGYSWKNDEKYGPYIYVLATVKYIHFDQDSWYYTVTRADTGTCQRADIETMKPILAGSEGEKAALEASQQTFESISNETKKRAPRRRRKRIGQYLFPEPLVRSLRKQATLFLNGKSPYACKIEISSVKFLVFCSLIYNFIDQVKLAFFPSQYDFSFAVISAVVWIVLCLELSFELFIRPKGYNALIDSEYGYAPSTARYINTLHLVFESIALILFTPELLYLNKSREGEAFRFSLLRSSLYAVAYSDRGYIFWGYLHFAAIRLRIFGLVRHWKNMCIKHTNTAKEHDNVGKLTSCILNHSRCNKHQKNLTSTTAKENNSKNEEQGEHISKAATIRTALFVVNSHRAIILLVITYSFVPYLLRLASADINASKSRPTGYLQSNNLFAVNDSEHCDYLNIVVKSWLHAETSVSNRQMTTNVLWAKIVPMRCSFESSGIITMPNNIFSLCNETNSKSPCVVWSKTQNLSIEEIPGILGLRKGVVVSYLEASYASYNNDRKLFSTTVIYNYTDDVSLVNLASFLLQMSMLLQIFVGLSVLNYDANRLVISPLRKMLRIVLLYAKNPFSHDPNYHDTKGLHDEHEDRFGLYETEKLITAISKITDLLRKCFGVAGSGIISTNLARIHDGNTVMLKTIPGKLVYALFGFAGINDFSFILRSLDQEVMILINDVANVVHNEVFRWGLGDGQCNKNSGSTFLMVYRIGDFKEVQMKKEKATNIIFQNLRRKSDLFCGKKTNMKIKKSVKLKERSAALSNMDILHLASLPGINEFTDRALLGLLKSFAGIQRDKSLLNWKDDMRLGAGVGAFSLEVTFGLDAGWAVEGAVGSRYKIDATYLSPHVNMAARLMSTCTQYCLTILLSEAVEELLSDPAREKIRHVDTVFVKGSAVKQKIFTFDARHQGCHFFLHETTPENADRSSYNFTPEIWNTDPDLGEMRRHITKEFEETFAQGRDLYINGDWPQALVKLKEADKIMIETVTEDELDESGISFDQVFEKDIGDGPSQSLISYIEKEGGIAPKNWRGVRLLTKK